MAKRKFGGVRATRRQSGGGGGSTPNIFRNADSVIGGSKVSGDNIFRGSEAVVPPKQPERPGGIKGLIVNAGELVRGAGTLPYTIPKMAVEDALAANAYLDTVTPKFLRVKGPGEPSREELNQKPLSQQFPLVGGMAASFGRTGRRVLGGQLFEDYGKAYNEGTLVGTIIEDAANVSMVAGAAAKGINMASQGAIADGVAAQTTADTITSKVIPNLEKEVAAAERRVAADTAQSTERINAAVADAAENGPQPKPMVETATERTRMGDAQARLDNLKGTLEQARADATKYQTQSTDLLQGQSKALVRAYRVTKTIEHLGGKVAGAPIQPYTASLKLLGKAGQQFVKLAPGLEARLGQYGDISIIKWMKEFRPERRKLGAIYDQMNAEAEAKLSGMYEGLDRVDRITGGNDDVFHAAALDLTGAAELIVDGYDRMRSTTSDEAALEVTRRIAELPSFDGTPEALTLSLDLARYRKAANSLETYIGRAVDPQSLAAAAATAESRGLPPQFVEELRRATQRGYATEIRDTVNRITQAGEQAGVGPGYRAAIAEFFSGVGAGDVLARLDRMGQLADRLGPGVLGQIEQVQAILRQSILEPLNQTYATGEGSAQALTPEELAARQERMVSNQPEPTGLENIATRRDAAMADAAERLQAAQQRIDEIAASRPFSPEVLNDLAAAVEKNVTLAYDLATRSVIAAMSDDALLAEIRTLARIPEDAIIVADRIGGEVRPDGSVSPAVVVDPNGVQYDVTPDLKTVDFDQVVRDVADRIERYAKTPKLMRDAPSIAQAAQNMEFEPLKLRGVKPLRAGQLEDAVRAETRAEDATRTAEYIRKKARKLRGAGEIAVQRIAEAGAKLMDAVADLNKATLETQSARERIAQSAEGGVTPRVAEPQPWQLSSTEYVDKYGFERPVSETMAPEPVPAEPTAAEAALSAGNKYWESRNWRDVRIATTEDFVDLPEEVPGQTIQRDARPIRDLAAEAANRPVQAEFLPGYTLQTPREAFYNALELNFRDQATESEMLRTVLSGTEDEAVAALQRKLEGAPKYRDRFYLRLSKDKRFVDVMPAEYVPENDFWRAVQGSEPLERFDLRQVARDMRANYNLARFTNVLAPRHQEVLATDLSALEQRVGLGLNAAEDVVNEVPWLPGEVASGSVSREAAAEVLDFYRDWVLQRETNIQSVSSTLDVAPGAASRYRAELERYGKDFADRHISALEAIDRAVAIESQGGGALLTGAPLEGVTPRSAPPAQAARGSEALPYDVIEPHLTAVADAVDQGKPVPPWVLDEYEPRKVPNEPSAAAAANRTPGAVRRLERRARIIQENELLDANPDIQRVRAGRQAAEQAWKNSPEGQAFGQLERRVAEMRKAVIDTANAELESLVDLPRIPYVPNDVSEYFGRMNDALGAPEFAIAEEAKQLFDRGGLRNPDTGRMYPRITREEAWRQAYASAWNRLPRAAQQQFERLTAEEVTAMALRAERGTVDPFAFGLDTLVDEYFGDRAPGMTPEESVRRFADDFERQARMRRMVNSGARGGFSPEDLDGFLAMTRNTDLVALADDPYVRGALESGTVRDAARSLSEGQASRRAAVIPDQQALAARLDSEPFPYDAEQMHAVLTDVLGSSDLADEAYSMWAEAQAAAERVGATIPSFEDSIAAIADEGRYPDWMSGQSVPAGTAERAVSQAEERARTAAWMDQALLESGQPAENIAALSPDERALLAEQFANKTLLRAAKELEDLIGTKGGAKVLDRMALDAEMAQARAVARAQGTSVTDARIDVMVRTIKGIQKQFVEYGKAERRYLDALDAHRKISREMNQWIPERFERERVRYRENIDNAPVRFRTALRLVDEINRFPKRITEEYAAGKESSIPTTLLPEVIRGFEMVATDAAKTLDDIVSPRYIGPDGQVRVGDQVIDPEYFPGGRLSRTRGHVQREEIKDATRIRTTPRERMKKSGAIPASTYEMRRVTAEQVYAEIRNRTARQIEAAFGVRASQVLGDQRMEELAQDYRRNRRRTMDTLVREMSDEGFVPWDPRKSAPFTRRGEAMGSFVIEDLDQLTANTLFIPSEMAKHFDAQFRAPGNVERWFRKWYDRPTNAWKGSVLAYSPRWHVNNNLGNFIMSTVGGGMSPLEWASGIQDAYAVLKYDEWKFELDNAEAFGHSPRKIARLRNSMAQAEQRMAAMDPETLAAMRNENGLSIDPRIPQRGSGSAALDPYFDENNLQGGRIRRALKSGAKKSYHLNGFVDDLNRVGLFIKKYRSMTDADLWEFAAKNPELAGLKTISELRNEAAVRMSLDALGNFRKMNSFERQWVRRVIPFYAWLRHITKLAYRLSVDHPARVAWIMHLSDLYGEPAPYSVLFGSIPFIGSTLLRLPTLNPFQDIMFLPSSGTAGGLVTSATSAIGPIPKAVLAAVGGIDARTLSPFRRPPGSGDATEYQQDQITPLITRPKELGYYLLNQAPQGRLAVMGADTALKGQPMLRYPTGQLYKIDGKPTSSGRSLFTEASGLFGIPQVITTKGKAGFWNQNVDLERINQSVLERQKLRETMLQNYQNPTPAGAGAGGGGSKNIFRDAK